MDIFILAGQSNMAGRGSINEVPAEFSVCTVQAFGTEWAENTEPLHVDIDLKKKDRCGVGPALVCMEQLRLAGWPRVLGVVPCAIGGVSLAEWMPEYQGEEAVLNCEREEGEQGAGGLPMPGPLPSWAYWPGASNLYGAMVDRARAALSAAPSGSEIRGVLWYQGETDAISEETALTYKDRFHILVETVRTDLGLPDLPFYTVALTTAATSRLSYWNQVREQQFAASKDPQLPEVHIVDAFGLPLQTDRLHLTTLAYVEVGKSLAKLITEATAQKLKGSTAGLLLEWMPGEVKKGSEILDSMTEALKEQEMLKVSERDGSCTNEVPPSLPPPPQDSSNNSSVEPKKPLPLFQKKRKFVNFVYGEIEFFSFSRLILHTLRPKPTDVFYDLGCGAGKAVYTMALLCPLAKAAGIELMQGYLQDAIDMHKVYTDIYSDESRTPFYEMTPPSNLQFIYGDILDEDWSDGTIIFACSTCFEQEQMENIARKAELTKEGTIVITFDKELPSTAFEIIAFVQCMGSWGSAVGFVHKKKVS